MSASTTSAHMSGDKTLHKADLLTNMRRDDRPENKAFISKALSGRAANNLDLEGLLQQIDDATITAALTKLTTGIASRNAKSMKVDVTIDAPTPAPESVALSEAAFTRIEAVVFPSKIRDMFDGEGAETIKEMMSEATDSVRELCASMSRGAAKNLRRFTAAMAKGMRPGPIAECVWESPFKWVDTQHNEQYGNAIKTAMDYLDEGYRMDLNLPSERWIGSTTARWIRDVTGLHMAAGTNTVTQGPLKLRNDADASEVYYKMYEKASSAIRARLALAWGEHCAHVVNNSRTYIEGLEQMHVGAYLRTRYENIKNNSNSEKAYLIELLYSGPMPRCELLTDWVYLFAVLRACGVSEATMDLGEMPEAFAKAGIVLRSNGGCLVTWADLREGLQIWFNLVRAGLGTGRADTASLLACHSAQATVTALMNVFSDNSVDFAQFLAMAMAAAPKESAQEPEDEELEKALAEATTAAAELEKARGEVAMAKAKVAAYLEELEENVAAVADKISVAKGLADLRCELTGQLENGRAQHQRLEARVADAAGTEADGLKSELRATVAGMEKTKEMLSGLQLPVMQNWGFVNKPDGWKAAWLAKSSTACGGDVEAELKLIVGVRGPHGLVMPGIDGSETDWLRYGVALGTARRRAEDVQYHARSLQLSVTSSVSKWAADHEAKAQKKADEAADHVKLLRSTQGARSKMQRRDRLNFRVDVYAGLLIALAERVGTRDDRSSSSVKEAVMAAAVMLEPGKALPLEICITQGLSGFYTQTMVKARDAKSNCKQAPTPAKTAMAAKKEKHGLSTGPGEHVEGSTAVATEVTGGWDERTRSVFTAGYKRSLPKTPVGADWLCYPSSKVQRPAAYRGRTMKAGAGPGGSLSGRQRGFIDLTLDGVEATMSRLLKTARTMTDADWEKASRAEASTAHQAVYDSPLCDKVKRKVKEAETTDRG
mgnify:CR=1 FL=1